MKYFEFMTANNNLLSYLKDNGEGRRLGMLVIMRVGKKQGKTKRHKYWSCLGITKDELLRQHPEGIPPEFDTDVLPNLTKNQVVFLNMKPISSRKEVQ